MLRDKHAFQAMSLIHSNIDWRGTRVTALSIAITSSPSCLAQPAIMLKRCSGVAFHSKGEIALILQKDIG